MSYFKYQGKNVYYEEMGNGSPLFLLHGNTASSNMFYEVAWKYAEHCRVILIDFLGHGRSDRLAQFPVDLWFDEAMQVIGLIKAGGYGPVDIIGSSGGALAAVNAALEAPDLVRRVIADSFEGETTLKAFTQNVVEDREASKRTKTPACSIITCTETTGNRWWTTTPRRSGGTTRPSGDSFTSR